MSTAEFSDASTSNLDEDDSEAGTFGTVITVAVPLIFFGSMIPIILCLNHSRIKEIRADAEILTRVAPRNCSILGHNDKAQRRLLEQIIQLCEFRWHHKRHAINVLNVGVVVNATQRQRYEQAYQAAAQSAVQTWNFGAANKACWWSSQGHIHTSDVSFVTIFERVVLRPGEVYLFYHADESELKAVLESEEEPAFSRVSCFGMTELTLEELSSSYGLRVHTSGSDAKYMFVVRTIVGVDTVIRDTDPKRKRAGRTYRKSNLAEVLPEFLVSYKVE